MRRLTPSALLLALLALFTGSVYAQISVMSPLSNDRTSAPGLRYDGIILIRNDASVTQQVRVYQSDYQFFADGTNQFEAPGSHSRSNAPWIQFSPALLTLPPGETLPIQYVVTVPGPLPSDLACGSFWSVLFVEAIRPGSIESTMSVDEVRDPGFEMRSKMRYGIQLATHLEGACRTSITFDRIELVTADDGTRSMLVDVRNDGAHFVRPGFRVEFYDATGAEAGRLDGRSFRLYPGTSVRQTLKFEALPEGPLEALLVVDTLTDVFAAQVSLPN